VGRAYLTATNLIRMTTAADRARLQRNASHGSESELALLARQFARASSEERARLRAALDAVEPRRLHWGGYELGEDDLTSSEAMGLLGVSRATFFRLVRDGWVTPDHRLGSGKGRPIYSRAAILAYRHYRNTNSTRRKRDGAA
jgi:predicted DNA-binding transcriptional regulator AlpA